MVGILFIIDICTRLNDISKLLKLKLFLDRLNVSSKDVGVQ